MECINPFKVVFFVVLAFMSSLVGAEDKNRLQDSFSFQLDGVFSVADFTLEGEPFNKKFPVNGFTELSNEAYELELRPTIDIDADACAINLKPRFRKTYYNDMGPLDGDYETETFFNTALARCRFFHSVELSVGRQRLQWGNSQFRSPSNPFFPETILFNPIDELIGKDFVILSYRPDFSWEFSALVNYNESHVDTPPNASYEFIDTYGVKVEYTGNSSHIGGLISQRDSEDLRYSVFSNYTVNRALLLYGELTASKDVVGLLPYRNDAGMLVGFERADKIGDKVRYTGLLGGSFTLENGLTLYLEYLHSNNGFTEVQAREWQQTGAYAATLLGTARMPEAVPVLADAVDPLWRQLRQNYVVLQLSRTQINNNMDIALQYVSNLDDHSDAFSASLVYQPTDSVEIFLVANNNGGGGDKEFGRIVKRVIQVGLRFYTF